jgi:hypothetical protein
MKRLIKSSTVQANRVDELLAIVDDSFDIEACDNINAAGERGPNVRLTSIPGVTRYKEGDFHDDGNNFTGYMYKGVVPISYLRSHGEIYLTIAFHHLNNISYEEYKQFPSYDVSDEFNGVDPSNYDATKFAENLEAAYQDIQDFLAGVQDADEGQLSDRVKILNDASAEYKAKVEEFISANAKKILNLNEYQFKSLKRYVKDAGSKTADYIFEASQSSKREFLREDIDRLKSRISNSWNFEYIEGMFSK